MAPCVAFSGEKSWEIGFVLCFRANIYGVAQRAKKSRRPFRAKDSNSRRQSQTFVEQNRCNCGLARTVKCTLSICLILLCVIRLLSPSLSSFSWSHYKRTRGYPVLWWRPTPWRFSVLDPTDQASPPLAVGQNKGGSLLLLSGQGSGWNSGHVLVSPSVYSGCGRQILVRCSGEEAFTHPYCWLLLGKKLRW